MFRDNLMSAREIFGDPYPTVYQVAEQSKAFALRLLIVVPLITIPTAISLWTSLSGSYEPDVALAGVRIWSVFAGLYVATSGVAVALVRYGSLSRQGTFFLNSLCLVWESVLTILVTYLMGAGVMAFCCFATMLVVAYRLFLGYGLGLLATLLSTLAWVVLSLAAVDLPVSPLLSDALTTMNMAWSETVWAIGYYLCGFVAANSGANQIHKLRAQLERAQSRLLQQGRASAVGHLVTGMAHELGNPLNVVHGGIEEIQEIVDANRAPSQSLSGDELEDIDAYLRLVGNGCKRIDEIVRNLNLLAATTQAEQGTSNVSSLVSSTVKLLDDLFEIHGIEVQVTVPRELRALINSSDFSQVILNLISNAGLAMKSGGRLSITGTSLEDSVQIDVCDTGCGIAEEVRSHIFDPFFTTREQGEGKGLGLSLSLQIVQDAGGELALLESAEGTHMRVTLRKPE